MFDKIKQTARKAAAKVSKEAPKYAKKARVTIEPFAKDAAQRAKPHLEKATTHAKTNLSNVQKEAATFSNKASDYVQSGKASKKAQDTLIKPGFRKFKKMRNYGIGLGFAAIAVFGFSYGMGNAITSSVKTTVKDNW